MKLLGDQQRQNAGGHDPNAKSQLRSVLLGPAPKPFSECADGAHGRISIDQAILAGIR